MAYPTPFATWAWMVSWVEHFGAGRLVRLLMVRDGDKFCAVLPLVGQGVGRVLRQADLAEALEDELFALRDRCGAELFPKAALDYLNDWAANDKGWLRKFYAQGSDEPHFDLTPATEKAIAWLGTLAERSFVGTESRLLTLFELLKQMSEGSETDPQTRIAELQRRRDEIDAEIARVLSGDMPMLDDLSLIHI